jgi:hypothetical protein
VDVAPPLTDPGDPPLTDPGDPPTANLGDPPLTNPDDLPLTDPSDPPFIDPDNLIDEKPRTDQEPNTMTVPDNLPITEKEREAGDGEQGQNDHALYIVPLPLQYDSWSVAGDSANQPFTDEPLRKRLSGSLIADSFNLGARDLLKFETPAVAMQVNYFSLSNPDHMTFDYSPTLFEIDKILEEMDQSVTTTPFHDFVTYAVSGASITLTVGVTGYLLRAGSLLSCFLATVPIWQNFDPLAILKVPNKKKNGTKEVEEEVAQTFKTTEQQVEEMFSEQKGRP